MDYQRRRGTSLQLQHARFQSWAERLNVAPGLLNDAFISAMAEIIFAGRRFAYLMRFAGEAKIGIITNGFTALQQTRLETHRAAQYFDLLVISERVGVRDPKIFVRHGQAKSDRSAY